LLAWTLDFSDSLVRTGSFQFEALNCLMARLTSETMGSYLRVLGKIGKSLSQSPFC